MKKNLKIIKLKSTDVGSTIALHAVFAPSQFLNAFFLNLNSLETSLHKDGTKQFEGLWSIFFHRSIWKA